MLLSERSLARCEFLAAFNCSVPLCRPGKRRPRQRGRGGESQDADKPVRGRHQEPVGRPGDPGMLHSEEGVPALRLGQVVSVYRAVRSRRAVPLKVLPKCCQR